MSITFENKNDVIIYALEKVISHARRTQQVLIAQCIWWLASVIGLEQGLINHIDNLQARYEKALPRSSSPDPIAATNIGIPDPELSRQDKVLKECKEFLRDSRWLRDLEKLNATGKTRTGRINRLAATKQHLRVTKKKATSRAAQRTAKSKVKDDSKTDGIDPHEIDRRKTAEECSPCAWPSDRKGTHRVKDSVRPIRLEIGTAPYPKVTNYQKPVIESVSKNETSDDKEDSSEEE